MEDFFLRIALQVGCKSVEGTANANVRRYAIKKNEPRRASDAREGSHDDLTTDDNNLLPTPSSLKLAFASRDVVLEILRCRCEALCGPLWSRYTAREDSELAHTVHKLIASDQNKLNALAVLTLSGCTFALREFVHSDCGTIDEFLLSLNAQEDSGVSEAGSRGEDESEENELRIRLLQRLVSNGCLDGETVSSLATKFSESIRAKTWLFRIRQFSISGQMVSIGTSRRHNMPFVEERQLSGARLNRRYLRFRIADGYALSEQLQRRTLFRKELRYHPSAVGDPLRQEGHDEVKILNMVNGLEHPNIAKMLFAFEEQSSQANRINIVFRYNEFSLSDILYRPVQQTAHILSRFDNAVQPPVPLEGMLEHGLWKAMLDIVDAVKSLHEFEHPTIRPDPGKILRAEHFDIKPANILVEIRNQRPAKLLLADFGRARVDEYAVDQSSGYPDIPTTYDYAPPEAYPASSTSAVDRAPATGVSGTEPALIMRRSYDTWSLGCVLLEVLVQAMTGDAQAFKDARKTEAGDNGQDAAFWYRNQTRAPRLRPATEKYLRVLKKSQQSNVERVARCIGNMLSVDEAQRREWPLTRCLAAFQAIEMPNWHDMIPSNARPLLDPELANMTTLCWSPKFQQPVHCNLFHFRKRVSGEADEVTLVVEKPGVPWKDRGPVRGETLVALPFFEEKPLPGSAQATVGSLRAAFSQLHQGMVFHWQRISEYLKFLSLMTHQHICLGRSSVGLDIRFQSCELTVARRLLPSKTEMIGAGRAQLWSTYDEVEYSQRFEAMSGLLLPTTTADTRSSISQRASSVATAEVESSLPAAYNSRFKLALFTSKTGMASDPGRRCIIVELDRDNIQLDTRRGTPRSLSFAHDGNHSSFPAAILGPSVEVPSQSGVDSLYPGIPMDPSELNESIRESSVRLKRLTLEFAEGPNGGANLLNLLALLKHYQIF